MSQPILQKDIAEELESRELRRPFFVILTTFRKEESHSWILRFFYVAPLCR